MDDSHLIDPKEAALRLGITPNRLAKLRMTLDGPEFVVIGRRSIRYSPVVIREWLDTRKRRSTESSNSSQAAA